mgnify:CR=1 FL=1
MFLNFERYSAIAKSAILEFASPSSIIGTKRGQAIDVIWEFGENFVISFSQAPFLIVALVAITPIEFADNFWAVGVIMSKMGIL